MEGTTTVNSMTEDNTLRTTVYALWIGGLFPWSVLTLEITLSHVLPTKMGSFKDNRELQFGMSKLKQNYRQV